MKVLLAAFLLLAWAMFGYQKWSEAKSVKLEPQSVWIEFDFTNSNGGSDYYRKVIPFETLLRNTENIGWYDCHVQFEGDTYQIGFGALRYPDLPIPSIEAVYTLGNVVGMGFAMSGKHLSVYDRNSKSALRIYFSSTQHFDAMQKRYPTLDNNNLHCYIQPRH